MEPRMTDTRTLVRLLDAGILDTASCFLLLTFKLWGAQQSERTTRAQCYVLYDFSKELTFW
jgi:hypothetical protein